VESNCSGLVSKKIISNVFEAQVDCPYYELTIFGDYDPGSSRYFLLTELGTILIYDSQSMNQLGQISINSISIQYPASMHYDPLCDNIWLLYTAIGETPNQWV
jgi:hypothetical protein